MPHFVENGNIARFIALLDSVSDPAQRKTLEELLKIERAKLALSEKQQLEKI